MQEYYSKMNPVYGMLLIISVVSLMGLDTVHAQPFEEVNSDILYFDGTFATIGISWNDDGTSYYEAGCVSCMPNLSETTTENSIILSNITPLSDGKALLYVIAYDVYDEIISAKQVIVQLPWD